MIAYTVTCTFLNDALAKEWIQWQLREHLADVMDAGALDAEVVKIDGNPVRCEVRYHFDSRDAFNRYEREHAARLRNEGLKKFPLDRGLSYVRSVGEVVGEKIAAEVVTPEPAPPPPPPETSPPPPSAPETEAELKPIPPAASEAAVTDDLQSDAKEPPIVETPGKPAGASKKKVARKRTKTGTTKKKKVGAKAGAAGKTRAKKSAPKSSG